MGLNFKGANDGFILFFSSRLLVLLAQAASFSVSVDVVALACLLLLALELFDLLLHADYSCVVTVESVWALRLIRRVVVLDLWKFGSLDFHGLIALNLFRHVGQELLQLIVVAVVAGGFLDHTFRQVVILLFDLFEGSLPLLLGFLSEPLLFESLGLELGLLFLSLELLHTFGLTFFGLESSLLILDLLVAVTLLGASHSTGGTAVDLSVVTGRVFVAFVAVERFDQSCHIWVVLGYDVLELVFCDVRIDCLQLLSDVVLGVLGLVPGCCHRSVLTL